jgi:hypothetical protein
MYERWIPQIEAKAGVTFDPILRASQADVPSERRRKFHEQTSIECLDEIDW